MIGSLLLGIPEDGVLTYAGKVGTGFTESALRELQRHLAPLEVDSPPFAGAVPAADARLAHWVCEVRFAEWTRDGRLRHPAWRGLRPDKSPEDVVRES